MSQVIKYIHTDGTSKVIGEITPEGLIFGLNASGRDPIAIGSVLNTGDVLNLLDGKPPQAGFVTTEGVVMKYVDGRGRVPIGQVDAAGRVIQYQADGTPGDAVQQIVGTTNALHLGAVALLLMFRDE
jgi:hypothetical protein